MSDRIPTPRSRPTDHASGAGLAPLGTADRHANAGTAVRGEAMAPRTSGNREVPRTGYEAASDLKLFERQSHWLKVQRQAQGQLDLIKREMKRRKRHA